VNELPDGRTDVHLAGARPTGTGSPCNLPDAIPVLDHARIMPRMRKGQK